jgi:hypothetical protein
MTSEPTTTRTWAAIGAAVAALAILGAIWLYARSSPPQIGGNEETVKAVDALFTAVTARNDKLLGDCERQLHALKDAGKLPDHASASLDGIIKEARDGAWESAAQTLYDFMKGQRTQVQTENHARPSQPQSIPDRAQWSRRSRRSESGRRRGSP